MSADQQHLYFLRREGEARLAAGLLTDSCARRVHLRMASAYGELAAPPQSMAPAHALTPLPTGEALFARPIRKGVPTIPPPFTSRDGS